MTPTLLLFIAYLAACISCLGAVVAWLITRRGSDAELKGDVNELALLVEKLAKTERRERMSRVRKGERESAPPSEPFPVPPGAEGLTTEGNVMPLDKNELRRRIMLARRVT